VSSRKSDFDSIPIIDIGGLAGTEATYADVIAQVRRAAGEVGFFYITGHGCSPALREQLLARARQFFAQPLDQKMSVYIGNSRNHRGYVPPGEEVFYDSTPDLKEAFDLSLDLSPLDPAALAHPNMIGPNQWPDIPGFADDVCAYYAAVFAIGKRLLQAFAAALSLPRNYFDRFVTAPPSQLRMIHYPFVAAAPPDRPGIGAHTDYECFTLLFGTAAGLEVMNGAGRWIDAPPLPDAFIINIGDLMEYWSDGRFVATSHRVRKVQEDRYAFPFFFCTDYDTRVAPLNSARDAAPLIAGDHLYAQTVQTFHYLQKRLAAGEIVLPSNALALGSFGQQAKQADDAAD
jgi:isopenicillin N synthase-like dioxygenase